MEEKVISSAVIKRLPRYYRYLGELIEEGAERISSGELSKRMNITASQIRQDLNNFGGFGQQGYGYNVQFLYNEIANILGLNKIHPMIIVGAGNFGQALANYERFERGGFKLVGVFDVNERLDGVRIRNVPIMMMDKLQAFLEKNAVEIAALTLPKSQALGVARLLTDNGIKAIWNFSNIDLNLYLPSDVVVENVHLFDSLMRLSYTLTRGAN